MKKKYWSDYAKYLVLSDSSSCKLKGTYLHYLNFKIVVELLNRISYTDKLTYSYDNDIYKCKVNSTDGKSILNNLKECRWNDVTEKILLVASQLKLQI
jgi:hypothetical protein